MGDERECEGESEEGEVIDAEIGVVPAYARCGVGKGIGAGEGRAVQEFQPWTALGECVADGSRQPVDE